MPYKDPEQRRTYGRDWIKRNPEKAREAMRRWRARHPEEHNADTRADQARNSARRNSQKAAYHKANPHVLQVARQRRRARKSGAEGSFSAIEWRELLGIYSHRCAYCGSTGPLQADHATPLSRGGSHYIENIRPACPSCNAKKHELPEDEYRARRAAEGLYVRPRLRRVPGFEETSGSFSASLMSLEG